LVNRTASSRPWHSGSGLAMRSTIVL
jgi:hypothetical protein